MTGSTLLLALGIAWVGAGWIRGVSFASKQAVPFTASERRRWIAWASGLFAAILVAESLLGISGSLTRFDSMPPPILGFATAIVILSFAIAHSRFGDLLVAHLPLSALIAFQAFRILAEALIYAAVREGIAPSQLSFEGYNYDIVTGITAIPLALHLRKRVDLTLASAWNWMGCAFLAVIFFIAMTSFPTPFRLFMSEPSNAWVATFPYILLPGILVLAALAGHFLIFRKLRALANPGQTPIIESPRLMPGGARASGAAPSG